MTKQDEIKQILIDMAYTPDAKPRFINDNWVGGDIDTKLKRIDEAVNKIMKAFEKTVEDKACEILCCDEYPVKDMIELIEDQAKVDGGVLIDDVDGVNVWEKMLFEFTCDEFLEYIGLKE